MRIFKSTLEMIGNTPMIELKNFDTGPCQLFLKLEYFNPGGSIKDRIALNMIEQAEKRGQLKKGDTIIEATAGNTGLGLALIASLKGYRLMIVMPDKMGKEKITHLRAMGAEVIITRSDVEKGHPDYYQDLAASIAKQTPNSYFINQFNNPDNPCTHEELTGPELWKQMDGKIDALVYGIGSSGTLTGIGKYLKNQSPAIEIILADPANSILADVVNHGKFRQAGKWLVEGIGEDFIPEICDLSLITRAITVSDRDSLLTGRELLTREGILAGSSTGTHLHAALEYCRAQTQPKRVVTFACDTGNKYLAKMFDDEWMWQQGFIHRQEFGDLRDLIARPFAEHKTRCITAQEPIETAHKHMLTHGISQLPVLDNGQLIGMVYEADILQAVYTGFSFSQKISEVMTTDFAKAHYTASIDALMSLFNRYSAVAIVAENAFYGLITPIDVINFLKRKSVHV